MAGIVYYEYQECAAFHSVPFMGGCAMADKKLAGTFMAWRLTLGVEAQNLAGALECFAELGFVPKVCGYQSGRILFGIILPCVGEDIDGVNSITPEMGRFHVATFHAERSRFVCPPAPEVKSCKVGEYLGKCLICGETLPVIGPIEGGEFIKGSYILIPHVQEDRLCRGTGAPPKGGIKRQYDGT